MRPVNGRGRARKASQKVQSTEAKKTVTEYLRRAIALQQIAKDSGPAGGFLARACALSK